MIPILHVQPILAVAVIVAMGAAPMSAAAPPDAHNPLDGLECWGVGVHVGFVHALSFTASTGQGSGAVARAGQDYTTTGHFVYQGTELSGMKTVYRYVMTGYTTEAVRCDGGSSDPCEVNVTKDLDGIMGTGDGSGLPVRVRCAETRL